MSRLSPPPLAFARGARQRTLLFDMNRAIQRLLASGVEHAIAPTRSACITTCRGRQWAEA